MWWNHTCTNALRIVAFPQETVNTTDRKRETSLRRATGGELAHRSRLMNLSSVIIGLQVKVFARLTKGVSSKGKQLTIEPTCCRWPCLQICLQSF